MKAPIDVVLRALRDGGSKVQNANGQRIAQCPAHEDRMPSMTVKAAADGKVLIHCHAGCDVRDIVAALGLSESDLFPDTERADEYRPVWTGFLDAVKELNARDKAPAKAKAKPLPDNVDRVKAAHYDYVDADGATVSRAVKYHLVDKDTGEIVGKTFTQQTPDGYGWRNGLNGYSPPLYRLPAVNAAIAARLPVFIVEGEKDADSAADAGITATTCPMGAGSWKQHHTDALAGANVGIVIDQDDAGRKHAAKVREELRAAGCFVTMLQPASGKDLTDHLEAGYGISDLIHVITDVPDMPDDGDDDGDDEQAEKEAYVRDRLPAIDWHELWADETQEEWIIEPILPARRLISLYSPPKVGKSLLMLEMAAAVACGRPMFGYGDAPEPTVVLYVDFENDPRGDIRERLRAMRYGPDDLGNLKVLSFPTMATLDSEQGSQELMAAVDVYRAKVVIIDTVSRAIKGDENENDTWLNFYRHTGLKMKQAGISLIRLDHTGKDEAKGQRGGSAKSGDVDAVWRLSRVAGDIYQLTCEANRFEIAQKQLTVTRMADPLRHVVDPLGIAGRATLKREAARAILEEQGIDMHMGGRAAWTAIRNRPKDVSQNAVISAQAQRRADAGTRELTA